MHRALKYTPTALFQSTLKTFTDNFTQSTRNTFVFKRKMPPNLPKKNEPVGKLKSRHFVYELIENTAVRPKPALEVILTTFVKGIGQRGDIVKVKNNVAYNELLLPGLAVYNTPENRDKYKPDPNAVKKEDDKSSPFAEQTVYLLEKLLFALVMNKDHPWTVEPWHIRVALRKVQIYVPDEAIELPSTPITGPDMTKQDKVFTAVVTINNMEKANVRFKIHHWATDPSERLPYVFEHWKIPAEPLFRDGSSSEPSPEVKTS